MDLEQGAAQAAPVSFGPGPWALLHEKAEIPEKPVCANSPRTESPLGLGLAIGAAIFALGRKILVTRGEKDGVSRLNAAQKPLFRAFAWRILDRIRSELHSKPPSA
ncbi:hypothetical protein [Stagnihabitans tardus]|uniref:Uncharacterized protein n=1 Tax=Stagnihabitans tardus TaxID=2699202 RepID=A0AAE5BTW2_9RHOB|nr:hypothetical protein [Stagnihabitans tardus]NBZ86134.1 hypothetical protein [Stagnihabitans tardus]